MGATLTAGRVSFLGEPRADSLRVEALHLSAPQLAAHALSVRAVGGLAVVTPLTQREGQSTVRGAARR